ncbi:hypothetical protein [Pontiella sp.]|uniref:hypothetical protein n=1 Tax=Pontiella sp. TaxID=2837462 RepID=UPI003562264C
MRQAEDLVWAAITDCAKQRFDYRGFKYWLSEKGDERVAEYILFQIIEGLAEELSLAELALKLRGDLDLFGYPVAEGELTAFLAGKPEALAAEVLAAREALAGFAQGRPAPELLERMLETLS